MYGLVNQAVKDLVLTTVGASAWEQITDRAGIRTDPFLAMSPYPDEVTYKLVAAASEVLERPAEDILETFGEFWITHSAERGYAQLLTMMGHDMPSFLLGLDGMHDRLRLSFPDLNPPSIWCTDVSAGSLVVHYASDRAGLGPFMIGLLRGTARRFGEEAQVRQLRGRTDGHDHEEFLVLRTPVPDR
jgi:Haem-NO-binding